jgi:hypothetical protein
LWLALREVNFIGLEAHGEMAKRNAIPFLYGQPGKHLATRGLLAGGQLALLMRPPDYLALLADAKQDRPPFELYIRGFGPDQSLARHLAGQMIAWDAAGRPSLESLLVKVYPTSVAYAPQAGEMIIEKRWMKYVFNWR